MIGRYKGGSHMGKPLEIDELWSNRIIVQIERTERSRFDQEARVRQPDVTQTKPVKATGKRYP
jgi:hypothetical protein